jgi:hypothetical protein
MRHLGSPGHRRAAKATPILMFLICLMLMEAINADRD